MWHDIKKHPMQVIVASCSVFMVVAFITILMTSLSILNPLFLSVNEASYSNSDFMLVRPATYVNLNKTSEIMDNLFVDMDDIR